MAFSGKRILVPGSSRGIGYATAAHFLSTGARGAHQWPHGRLDGPGN
ncbi:MAG: hypothetical protein Ct9H300mP14_04620 [Gammaproteobacteria bacterium]|nr:MAG: hypothetical protein Ct9H300mP14_04620 [Gammaproteobacteria bacterium]